MKIKNPIPRCTLTHRWDQWKDFAKGDIFMTAEYKDGRREQENIGWQWIQTRKCLDCNKIQSRKENVYK